MAIAEGLAAAGSAFNLAGGIYDRWYNRKLQEKTWEREDTAVQRRVADLRAAGLSPTLAAGSAASSGSPISVPSMPSIDIQGALGIVSAMKDISKTDAETKRILEETRGQNMANNFYEMTTKPYWIEDSKDDQGNVVHNVILNPRLLEYINNVKKSGYSAQIAQENASLKGQEADMYTALKNLGIAEDAINLILGAVRTFAPAKSR